MIIIPFERVADVPTGAGGRIDILKSNDLIDIMDRFRFQSLRATNKPYYRGVSAYMFDAQMHIGFDKDYKIVDVEIRHPFSCLEGEGIFFGGLDLVCPTLLEVRDILHETGISTKEIDVGLEAPDIGVSFFSSDYEGNLAVRLDAITVHLKSPT